MINSIAVQGKRERLAWADACRVGAIFGVILLHTAAPIFYDYKKIPLGHFLSATLADSLARVAVPLFLMISGALLLDTKYTERSLGGRIFKVATPLFFWSLVYMWWVKHDIFLTNSIFYIFGRIFSGPVMYHLEFVYRIIGVYLLLPFLRIIHIAFVSNGRLACYFFGLWFLINCLSIYVPVHQLIFSMRLTSFLGWPGYFLLGAYLVHSTFSSKLRQNMFGSLSGYIYFLACVTKFSITWWLAYSTGSPNELAYEYLSPNVLLASIAAFMWFQKIRLSNQMTRIVNWMSRNAFSIYFMHLLVIEIYKSRLLNFSITPNWPHPSIGIVLFAILIFLTSLVVSAVVRLIPGSARFIG